MTRQQNLLGYDGRGKIMVLAAGSELLVHDGATEAPLWRAHLTAPIVATGLALDTVVAVDEAGTIHRFEATGGRTLGRTELGWTATGAAIAGDGAGVVLGGSSVAIAVQDRAVASLEVEAPSCAAFRSDHKKFAIGTERGSVILCDRERAAILRRVELGEPVTGICWSARGHWIATAGEGVYRIPADVTRSERLTTASGLAPSLPRCSPDGKCLAVRLDARTAIVLALHSRETLASVSYVDREICGLAFGPEPWLGVALEGGDGNKIHLVSSAVHRTDTHPGRLHRSWYLGVTLAGEARRPSVPVALVEPTAPAPSPISVRRVALGLGLLLAGVILWLAGAQS